MDGRRQVDVTARTLSLEGTAALKNCLISHGVAVSCIGWQMGKAVIVDRPTITNQQINSIVPNPNLVDDKYLYYLLTSKKDEIFRLGAGGSRTPILNKSGFADFRVELPPLPEQKAIASILGALDDKIELNRRMNATLEAMARALFQSWFVDFDPVRAKLDGRQPAGLDPATAALFPASFQDSPLGPIPAGWKTTHLRDLTSKIGSGATPRGGSAVYLDTGVALIRSQNVYDNEFHWDGLARLSEFSANELRNVEVQQGDVLLNITGDSILRTCVVDPSVLPARVNQHVAIIRAVRPIPARFLHLYLVQSRIKETLMGMNAGATRPAITKGHLESVVVLHPDEAVLAAFDLATADTYRRVEANHESSRTLASLRESLLPGLLSGQLPIGAAELVAGGIA
jgi:type I restriction enzyme S subunit